MLRFQQRPDKVFLTLFHNALEATRQDIKDFIEGGGDDEEWRDWLVPVARSFSPRVAVQVIDRLLFAHKDNQLYQLTDYHWLLIYICLSRFCEIHNDFVSEHTSGKYPVGPYEIGSIDFDAIVDNFFWDTDFLMEDILLDVGSEGRKQLGVSPEAFGIAAGLAAHPSELEIRLSNDGTACGSGQDPYPDDGPISCYPLGEED